MSVKLGLWTMLGTYALLTVIASITHSFTPFLNDLQLFFSGQALEIPNSGEDYRSLVGYIAALLVVDLPLLMVAGIFTYLIAGDCGAHAVQEAFRIDQEERLFKRFFLTVFLEEMFARWFFLGVVAAFFSASSFIFYLMFLTGNGIWALLHLNNFKKKEDRDAIRVLPQFAGGVLLTVIFMRYGIIGAVLAHFAANALICSVVKKQRFDSVDLTVLGYSALFAAVSYGLMERSPLEALHWLESAESYQLSGWGFKDYLLIVLFVSMTLVALAELLCYDKNDIESEARGKVQLTPPVIFGAASVLALLLNAICRFVNMVIKRFIQKAAYRAGALALLACFSHETRSPSAIARSFWVGLPVAFTWVSACLALSFWQASLMIFMVILIESPLAILKTIDD